MATDNKKQHNIQTFIQSSDTLPMLKKQTFQAGEVIFPKGQQADFYYIVDEGCVEIRTDNVVLANLEAGAGFGEMAIFSHQEHTASAIAKTDTTVSYASRKLLSEIMEVEPDLKHDLLEQMRQNRRYTLLASTLSQVLGEIDADIFNWLTEAFSWHTYQAGDVIFSKGDMGDELFFLITGRVRVSQEMQTTSRILGELGRGTMFGELALLTSMPRSATILAIRETTLVSLKREAFERLLEQSPAFARRLLAIIAKRTHENSDDSSYLQLTPVTFAIIKGQEDVEMQTFLDVLHPRLEQHGRVTMFDEEAFKNYSGITMPIEDVPSIVTQGWMSKLEDNFEYIFFIIDDPCSAWANLIITNMDRVIIVDNAQNSPQPEMLNQCIKTKARYQVHELILLHERDVERPSGTEVWLQAHDVERHHHVRRGDLEHTARVARLLTGNGIGLVLGGGGARGYAHIGVLKGLLEAGVPIDAVGSVSMGSVIGSAFLAGLHTEDVIAKIIEDGRTYGSKAALLDTTIPISAMMRSKKVTIAMEGISGAMNIEDGWIPFFCVSTNLTQQSLKVHWRGKLHQAVRASLSIPGIFSPVVRDGDLIVDGGVMNNFPVDIMREFLEGGTIIGTIVKSSGTNRVYEIDDEIDGIHATLSRLLPWMKAKRVPSILKTIMAASSVNAYARQAEYREQTDFLLETDTTPYSTMDFDNIWELSEMGYDLHRDEIMEWATSQSEIIG